MSGEALEELRIRDKPLRVVALLGAVILLPPEFLVLQSHRAGMDELAAVEGTIPVLEPKAERLLHPFAGGPVAGAPVWPRLLIRSPIAAPCLLVRLSALCPVSVFPLS